jgi:molybdopterin-guanine dinucleotide biosynthesis protein A
MSVLGYVQAGGGSARFGKDKALVELGGKSLLTRTTDLVASVCSKAIIVAAERKYSAAPAPLLADRWPGQGPLGGILTALEASALQTEGAAWNLIVSCDMPFLTREWLHDEVRHRWLWHDRPMDWSHFAPAGARIPRDRCGRRSMPACARYPRL